MMMTRPINAVAATSGSEPKKRYYRKNVRFFSLIEKIKLWPSRAGVLHGVKSIAVNGDSATILTHCGETFTARDSRTSRAARWLRNKWYAKPCRRCQTPDWKIAKYSATVLNQKWGAGLGDSAERPQSPNN
ncbi:MAG: hypothetical protein LBU39_03015 [Desulfobulbaceae bacterium]|jgi:pyrrolysyl-tRNA synthetase-like protein|nr:hypothetical protein [Desulfobulbaceae bacterium]